MSDPIDGMAALPGVYMSVEEARRKILEKDHPEFIETSPEG